MSEFKINSNFQPNGDQPNAIRELSEGIIRGINIKLYLV